MYSQLELGEKTASLEQKLEEHKNKTAEALGGVQSFVARTDTTHCSLPTAHYSLLTAHYSLHTTHYALLTTHYSLLTTHYSLLTIHYSLLTTHYSLLTTRYHTYFLFKVCSLS